MNPASYGDILFIIAAFLNPNAVATIMSCVLVMMSQVAVLLIFVLRMDMCAAAKRMSQRRIVTTYQTIRKCFKHRLTRYSFLIFNSN